ncbi:MAG: TatD family hydrolase [Patescibacteria group bacterium]|nr:MAG: TatD family hydrolase [Patescibacteria group bacterium]
MLIDTHCHLDWDSYEGELDGVLQRARDAGVQGFVTIGTDRERNEKAKVIAAKYGDVYRCVGYHPDVVVLPDFNEEIMREWLGVMEVDVQSEKVVGVGEIGLDYYALEGLGAEERSVKVELQKELLERQIILAKREGVPVSLHVRDNSESAYWDVMEVLREHFDDGNDVFVAEFAYAELVDQFEHSGIGARMKNVQQKKLNGVLHCVSGPLEYLQEAVSMGFCVGVCGNVTFKNAELLRENLKRLPLEMMVLETDAPFLSPEPYRGKRNEPAYMQKTAEKLAEIKGITVDEVCRITTENAQRLWGI